MVRIPGVNVHGRVEPEPSDDTQKKNRKDDAPNSQRTELAGNGRTHEVGGRADPEDDNRGKTNINRGQADAQQFGSVADTSQSNGDIGKEQRNAVGVVGQKISGFAEGILGVNDITILSDNSYQTLITCEKAKFNIAGKCGDDFAYLPEIERSNSIVISQFTLKEVIRQTIFSIADNDNNRLMTGELFEINGDELKVVSLDGHRISIRKIQLKDTYEPQKVVIPGKTLNEVSKILSGETEKDVSLFFTDNQVVFEFDQTTVVSRLIEGEYFRIDQMLSSDYETKVTINKRELLSCIDRATLLVKEGDKKPIIISITDGLMELKINSAIGSMDEQIDIEKSGKDLMIGFNPRFLIDALRVIDDEQITIYLVNPKAPCFIRNEENSYIYLILPVNFTTV